MLEGAGEGALDGGEADLLDWLSKAWNIKIEIADGACLNRTSAKGSRDGGSPFVRALLPS